MEYTCQRKLWRITMRMRRKKGLEERIENSNLLIPVGYEVMDARKAVAEKCYLDLDSLYKNKGELWLEIGCGKGSFAIKSTKANPQIRYLAVEKLSNVIISAVEKAEEEGIENVRFISTGAEYLPRYLVPNSVSKIFINFPTPLPNSRTQRQRLTAPTFLEVYKNLLVKGGEIRFKTDKEFLYQYTLETMAQAGFEIVYQTENLHQDKIPNIITEYEQKFTDQGFPIYSIHAKKI